MIFILSFINALLFFLVGGKVRRMDESLLCPTLCHDECSLLQSPEDPVRCIKCTFSVQRSWSKACVAKTQIEMPHTPVMSTTGKFDFAVSYIYTCVVFTISLQVPTCVYTSRTFEASS